MLYLINAELPPPLHICNYAVELERLCSEDDVESYHEG